MTLAEAVHREALVNYQRAIYTALRDVSDALAVHARTSEERTQQERLVDALDQSVRLATDRYRGGLDSYLPVLDAQRNLFQGELDSRGSGRGSLPRSCRSIGRSAAAGGRNSRWSRSDSTERAAGLARLPARRVIPPA